MRVGVKEPGKGYEVREIENSLSELQKIVGGYIEVVARSNSLALIANEEGRLMGLKRNIAGLVGTIAYVGVDENGEFASLTNGQVNIILGGGKR